MILSDTLWNQLFGRDPAVIGKKVMADDIPYTVIGILPPSFWSPDPAELLVPWVDSDLAAKNRSDHDFGVIGHLKPGVSIKQANADIWALLFTLLTSVATSLLFGLAPAFAGVKAKMHDALKEGSRGSSSGGNRLRNAFAVSEVALALVLLIGSALIMKSFWRVQQVHPGFVPHHVLPVEMELPTDSKYRTRPGQAEFFRRLLESLRVLPMARAAGV